MSSCYLNGGAETQKGVYMVVFHDDTYKPIVTHKLYSKYHVAMKEYDQHVRRGEKVEMWKTNVTWERIE